MSAQPFHFSSGTAPLLISIPHLGLEIPDDVEKSMTPAAKLRADTDWHVDRLYDFASALGASVLAARFSRYLIDLNRDPENKSLYPGANVTELCPTSTFDEEPLYPKGGAPDDQEIARRREAYWRPYHAKLVEEIARLKKSHGRVILWEAHSIRSHVPRFFQGKLPDLNFGTGGGTTASAETAQHLEKVAKDGGFTWVMNGRFKGGYITRAYGKPAEGVEAIQLELAQSTYMEETPPFQWREDLAGRLKPVLRRLLEAAVG